MRALLPALLAAVGYSSAPAIDHEQLRSDAACELVYCCLTAAEPARPIPRPNSEATIPAAPAAAAPVDRAPPKVAAPPTVRHYTAPRSSCAGGNCRPRRFRR